MKGAIPRCNAPKEKERDKYTVLSINSHYSCGCNSNRNYGYHSGCILRWILVVPAGAGLILVLSTVL